MLLGAAVADDGALHFGRRVLDHLAAGLDGGEHRDAARVPELQRAADVDGVKQVLDGDAVGPAGGEQRRQLAVDAGETLRETRRRRGAVMAPQVTRRWRRPSVSTQP